MGRTIAEKVLSDRSGSDARAGDIVKAEVDYVMVNDVTGPIAFREFAKLGTDRIMRDRIVLVPDHYVPAKDVASAEQAREMREFARRYGIPNYYEVGRSGVCHQLMVEEGFAAPGRLIVGADSHSCTYGGLNAFSTGIGSTEAAAVFATGRMWFRVPESIRIALSGRLKEHVGGKDLILRIIGDIGTEGASYRSMEFCGDAASLSVSDRLSVCNMAVEAGAKAAVFPCDSLTESYMEGRARGDWRPVSPDPDASYVDELEYSLGDLVPYVACPSSPANCMPAAECGAAIDQAYLGSCTNGRIEDMREAASILKGRRVHPDVRMIVVPASKEVYGMMADEGLIRVFLDAGAYVSGPTCGACLGGHMGVLASGEAAVSSTNRNFLGRMGHRDSKVYLAGPAVVAASAVAGRIVPPEGIA